MNVPLKMCLGVLFAVMLGGSALAMQSDAVGEASSADAIKDGLVNKEMDAIQAQIQRLKQVQQIEELHATLAELRQEREEKKRGQLGKKATKIANNLLDRVDTYLSIGVPILCVLVLFNIARSVKSFLGLGSEAPRVIYPLSYKLDEQRKEFVPVFDANTQGCRSSWPFSWFDPAC